MGTGTPPPGAGPNDYHLHQNFAKYSGELDKAKKDLKKAEKRGDSNKANELRETIKYGEPIVKKLAKTLFGRRKN